MTDYRPIPCALYGRFEVAIMHAERLRIRWTGPGGVVHLERVRPIDLITRDSAEYLLAERESGERIELRLDYLQLVEDSAI